MKKKIIILITLFLTFMLFSCNRVTPAGFWKNFKSDKFKENISDQGPYGGHRAIYWKTHKQHTFNSKNVIEFATRNGWELIDSFKFKPDQMKKWEFDGKPIFPFSYSGFSDTMTNFSTLEYFPRWINSEIKVFVFKTGSIAVEPGNAKSTEENGFAILNNEGTEMSIYHLWGE